MSIVRHGVTRRYADSVVHGGTVYLVEVPPDLDADITAQTAACWPRPSACWAGRQRPLAVADGHHLPGRHGRLRGDERHLGRLAARRLCAGAGLRRSAPGRSAHARRNGIYRRRLSGLNFGSAVAALPAAIQRARQRAGETLKSGRELAGRARGGSAVRSDNVVSMSDHCSAGQGPAAARSAGGRPDRSPARSRCRSRCRARQAPACPGAPR
jgi:hypothetical protein